MSAALSPAERRGYPLPPWTAAESPAEHNGADVLEYLLGLLDPAIVDGLDVNGVRQAEAYLDAWLERHRAAQLTASRCALEDHAGQADELEGLRTELAEARAAVRDAYSAGHADGVELAAARQYVDGHLPDDVVDLLEQLENEEAPRATFRVIRVADLMEELGAELLEGAGYEPAAVKCPALCPCDTL